MSPRERALGAVADDALEGEVTTSTPASKHQLVLGDNVFDCGPKLPFGTLVRYADNGLAGLHFILVKLIDPEDHERMWDAFEALDEDDVTDAVKLLIESYADRPLDKRTSSRGGSKGTGRR